jgi:hypothetical protein
MWFIESLKENKFIRMVWFFPYKFIWNRSNKIIEDNAKKRSEGFKEDNFLALYNLRNLYENKRCFIIAMGPSLKMSDIELLKNEITFSMNSVCKIFDKTEWRPTFYGIQDRFVYSKMEKIITKYFKNESNVFVSDELDRLYEIPSNYIKFPFNSVYHLYDQQFGKFYSKFSSNAYSIVYDGYSITYSLIQIAIFMGFKEIYLLGTDCNYKKNADNHFVESGHYDKREYLNYDKMITGYKAAKQYADKNDIKIVNCTRGGMLEVFERKAIEDVLGLEKKGVNNNESSSSCADEIK